MVYRRRGRRGGYRRRYRRGRKTSWGGTAWNLAKKAASSVVKYYLNPEYKFLDWGNSTISPGNSTGEVYGDPSWLAAGTSEITRTGNTIKITSMQFHAIATINNSATVTNIRMVLVSDISSDGVAPTYADIFENISTQAFVNRDYGRRFRILMDKHIVVDKDRPQRVVKWYSRMQHHIKYLDGSASDSALGQGAIYAVFLSSETTNTPTISVKTRARYLDN